MSKAARALLKKINDKKNAIRGLQGQGKTQEMKDQMAELREMQEEFDMLMEMEEDDDDGIKDSLHNGKVKEIEDGQKSKKYSKAQVCKAFVNRIVCGLRKRAMPEEDQEIMDSFKNMMKEGVDEDGGFTVPEDVSTDIIELRRTENDDFSIGSGSIKGEQRAVKALDKWMTKNQHLQIKETTGIIKLLPIEEEKRRRNLPRPGQRGVPMLDMAGYRISRTHITIRRRVFKRARRQLIRGYRELKRDGTLRRERAQKIISYNSYIEQSDSFHLQERYHTEELLQVAHRVNGFYGQLEYQKRMEELHDLLERRCRSEAGKGNDGKSSGWRNDRQDGGQYQGIPSGRRKGSEDVPF